MNIMVSFDIILVTMLFSCILFAISLILLDSIRHRDNDKANRTEGDNWEFIRYYVRPTEKRSDNTE